MKRILTVGAIILVIAAVVAVYLLSTHLGSLVAAAIEKYGSEVTETSVDVSGVEISLRKGRGSIDGLRVASPDGFAARDAFVLNNITLDLDVASVREDPIVIEEIRIRAPVINAKFKQDGSSNIDELRKRVQAHSRAGAESKGGVQKKLRIKSFVFEQGKIEVDASVLGLEARTVALPEIRLANLGGQQGSAPDQIARLILDAAAKQVASEIAGSEINRLIKEQLGESLPDKAKELLKRFGK